MQRVIKRGILLFALVAIFAPFVGTQAKGGGCYWTDGPLIHKNGAWYVRFYQLCDANPIGQVAYRKTGAYKDVFHSADPVSCHGTNNCKSSGGGSKSNPPKTSPSKGGNSGGGSGSHNSGGHSSGSSKPRKVSDAPSKPKYPAGYLYNGSTGSEVKTLQTNLNTLGANPKLSVDGIYGSKTEAAVSAFQSKNKIKATGVVDPTTKNKIAAAAKAINSNPVANALYPTLGQQINADPVKGYATVQFAGDSVGNFGDQMKIQVMYRKVGDSRWTSFGTASAEDPQGHHPKTDPSKSSVPNKLGVSSYVDAYGWTCAMGWGSKGGPKNCDTVWSNGKITGKPAWSGYKTYSPSVGLTPGKYEYAVRAIDVTTKKYSKTWSKTIQFDVVGTSNVDNKSVQAKFETLKTDVMKLADYGKLKDWSAKNGLSVIIKPSGEVTFQ